MPRLLKIAMPLLTLLTAIAVVSIVEMRQPAPTPEAPRQSKTQPRPPAPSHKPGDEAQAAFPEGTPALKALGRPRAPSRASQENTESDELRLEELRNSKDEIVRISNEVHAPHISFTLQNLPEKLLKFGDGVAILRAISLPDPDSEDRLLHLLKDAGRLPLDPSNEINFFPVQIVDRGGAEHRAWLLSSLSLKKTSIYEDGLPAGLHVGEEAMAYKCQWCLLPMDDPPPLRSLAWVATFERNLETP